MLGVLLCTEHADFYKRDDWTIEDGKYEQCRSAQGPVIGFIRQKKIRFTRTATFTKCI